MSLVVLYYNDHLLWGFCMEIKSDDFCVSVRRRWSAAKQTSVPLLYHRWLRLAVSVRSWYHMLTSHFRTAWSDKPIDDRHCSDLAHCSTKRKSILSPWPAVPMVCFYIASKMMDQGFQRASCLWSDASRQNGRPSQRKPFRLHAIHRSLGSYNPCVISWATLPIHLYF